MAGGTWDSQNKVRAGVYIRFRSNDTFLPMIGDRGVVAIAEPLSWGPFGVVSAIEAGTDVTPITGYPMSDSHNRFLQEIFRGSNRTSPAQKVLLWRPTASSSASATATLGNLTATAKYAGARGNDISVAIIANTDSTFTVQTIVDGAIIDAQTVSAISGLVANEWVTWSGTGALAANSGTALTGGANGTVASSAYATFLTNIEPYKFNVICYDGTDATAIAAFVSFVNRIYQENGQYSQLVIANATTPDSPFVINVMQGVVLADGTTLSAQQACWWVAGVEAGAKYNESLTFAQYPGSVAVSSPKTNSQIIAALEAGQFVFNSDDGVAKVESDINSLVTYTEEFGKIYHKNRVMRLVSQIANDIYAQFSANFIGVVNNNETGRSRFKAAIVGYLLEIQSNEGIQNFSAEDVTVEPGTDIDAIVINIAIQAVDAAEKIYMTIEVA